MPGSSWDRYDLPIGEAIFIARTSLDMTHEVLAAKTGVHRNTLLRLEKGERPPSLSVLTKISVGLGIELSKLVRRAEQLKPAP
jgi:transcriptional regulator with XRE-family HTH domain